MRRTCRSRWIIVMCRAACFLLASLALACSRSDEASPLPTPTSPTLPTPPTPSAYSGRLQVSGRVLDQNGTPVPGALVVVIYSSACASASGLWLGPRGGRAGGSDNRQSGNLPPV